MINHALNLFAIDNLAELSCTYRLLEVTNLPRNAQYPENLQRLAGMVAKETRKPVCVYKSGHRTYLATTATPDCVKPEWRLIPHVAVLVSDPNEYQLDYSAITPEQVEAALNLLRYDVRTALMKVPGLWNDAPSSFYLRKSINHGEVDQADMLEGFVYRLHDLNGGIYISLDPTFRYVDRRSLLERLNAGEEFRNFRFQHFLYRFGHQWYRVQLMGMMDNSIAKQQFYHEKHGKTYNVYDYTLQSCRSPHPGYVNQLDPDSPAILYRYPNTSKEFYGAAALCFKTYKTDAPQVRDLHPLSILDPTRRLQKSQELVRRYFQNILFGHGMQLAISDQPLTKSMERLEVPDLLFGAGRTLRVRRHSEDSGIRPQDLGKERMRLLLGGQSELLTGGTLQAQYIFIPATLHRSVGEQFRHEFIEQMEQFLSRKYNIILILYDDSRARNLRQQAEAIKRAVEENRIDRGCALLILPERVSPDLHNFIKRELFEILQFQCVNAASLMEHFHLIKGGYTLQSNMRGRFKSYTRYTALGMLLVNRKWPFALKDPLHYDLYIGIDVLNSMAGFTYIYNGGKDCYFRHYRSTQSEKLSRNQISNILYKDLRRDITRLELQPHSIIIHRDGRCYTQEEKGFVTAVRSLQEDGFLSENVEIGAVEIHKTSSAQLRIYQQRDGTVCNPRVGAYFVINDRQGIVCNTGWPFRFPGTVNPLHLSIAYGTLDIEKVLADVFALAQLAWSAPDKPSRLPITIKLGDMFLRPIASESDEEAALYGGEEPTGEVATVGVSIDEARWNETL